jgi:hypothetical protein
MSLQEILGTNIYNNLILSQKSIKLSEIKKEDRSTTKMVYYDCNRSIKELINLENFGIDMHLCRKSLYNENKPKIIISLQKFSKLKLLFLNNITTNCEDRFFDHLFLNIPFSLEILILKISDSISTFDTVIKFLINLPLNLKYIVFINVTCNSPKRIYYGDKIKVPFGCKLFHNIYSSKSSSRLSNNFVLIDEYEEDT